MLALDRNLVVSVPFEDRLVLDTSVDTTNVVPTDAGSVTLRTTMPGKKLEQRFAVASPLFLRSGVWLLASSDEKGQPPVAAPTLPNVSAEELGARVASLRTKLAGKTQDLEQTRDLL